MQDDKVPGVEWQKSTRSLSNPAGCVEATRVDSDQQVALQEAMIR